MTREKFINALRQGSPEQIVNRYKNSPNVTAFKTPEVYASFIQRLQSTYERATEVCIMGSGNWGYSLNPDKDFRPFGAGDVDVAIVSEGDFMDTWNALREHQRRAWYTSGKTVQVRFMDYGRSVYSGYISPEWLERGHGIGFRYKLLMNQLGTDFFAGRLPVKALFFRSTIEMVDYYKRGIMFVRGGR